MGKSDAIPVRSTDSTSGRRGTPLRGGNALSRHRRGLTYVAGLALVGAAAAVAVTHGGGDSKPTIGVHMTLAECGSGHRDTRPQHMGLYDGQQITVGIGSNALSHTVTLTVEKGSRLKQDEVEKGVLLVTGDGPQPVPGEPPVGTTLVYTLDQQTDVTITAHTTPDPLVTDVAIVRSC